MKRRYNKLISAGMSRYIAVGLSVYALELLIILVAQKLGASSILAIGLSYWTGLLVSFWLQKIITFKDRRMHKRILAKQILYTYMLVIFNFLFTITLARMLGSTVPAVISRTLAISLTTIWNFYLYKTRIFGDNELPPIE